MRSDSATTTIASHQAPWAVSRGMIGKSRRWGKIGAAHGTGHAKRGSRQLEPPASQARSWARPEAQSRFVGHEVSRLRKLPEMSISRQFTSRARLVYSEFYRLR